MERIPRENQTCFFTFYLMKFFCLIKYCSRRSSEITLLHDICLYSLPSQIFSTWIFQLTLSYALCRPTHQTLLSPALLTFQLFSFCNNSTLTRLLLERDLVRHKNKQTWHPIHNDGTKSDPLGGKNKHLRWHINRMLHHSCSSLDQSQQFLSSLVPWIWK